MAIYDPIAAAYRESKQLPFRSVIETHTLFALLGDIRGLRLLDLACGEGFYTRKLKRAGASEVIGVDISSAMIRLAREQEERRPLGCRYVCADAGRFRPQGRVDLIVAMYLFHYAGTRENLLRFCRRCREALPPGGRVVGFLDNVNRPPDGIRGRGDFKKYGFEKRCEPPRRDGPREGDGIRYRFTNPGGESFEFANGYFRPETYRSTFAAAGFPGFTWEGVRLHPDEQGNPFWDDFLAAPPMIAFSAR